MSLSTSRAPPEPATTAPAATAPLRLRARHSSIRPNASGTGIGAAWTAPSPSTFSAKPPILDILKPPTASGWLTSVGSAFPGLGAAQDWFRKAAAMGDGEAMASRPVLPRPRGSSTPCSMKASPGSKKVSPPMIRGDRLSGDRFHVWLGHAQGSGQGLVYLLKAADMGYIPAMNNLGIAYENGVGATKDYTSACLVPESRRPGRSRRHTPPFRIVAQWLRRSTGPRAGSNT